MDFQGTKLELTISLVETVNEANSLPPTPSGARSTDPSLGHVLQPTTIAFSKKGGAALTISWKPPAIAPITLPSLHIIGDTDQIIPKQSSLDVAKTFQNPAIHNHPGGHQVPMKAADLNKIVDFITIATTTPTPPLPPPIVQMSDADRDDQSDEMEALEAIFFEDELKINKDGIQIIAFTYLSSPIYLTFSFPPTYPSLSRPKITLTHTLSMHQFPTRLERAVVNVANSTCEEEIGQPSVMQVRRAKRSRAVRRQRRTRRHARNSIVGEEPSCSKLATTYVQCACLPPVQSPLFNARFSCAGGL